MRIILIIILLSFSKFSFSSSMIDYLNQQTPSMLDFGLYKIRQELEKNENENLRDFRFQIGRIAEYNHLRHIIDKRYEEEFKGKYSLWDLAGTKRELIDFFENRIRIQPYSSDLISVDVNQEYEMFFYTMLKIKTPYDFQFDELLEKSSETLIKEFKYDDLESIFDDDLETLCKAIRFSMMYRMRLFPFNESPSDGLFESKGDFTFIYDFDRSSLNPMLTRRFWLNHFSSSNYGIYHQKFVEQSSVIFSVLIKYQSANKSESIICYGKNTETPISFKKGGYHDLDDAIWQTFENF